MRVGSVTSIILVTTRLRQFLFLILIFITGLNQFSHIETKCIIVSAMPHNAKSKPEVFWNEDKPEAKAKRFWNRVQQAIERGTIVGPPIYGVGHDTAGSSTSKDVHENDGNNHD
jgi:hypothetical protein